MLNEKDFPPLPSRKARREYLKTKAGRPRSLPVRSAGSVVSFNDLPDELILQILDYLPCLDLQHFQLPSLISLSLTNRRLHSIVSDRLYAAFNSFFCNPFPFLRTVISNTQLAEQVLYLKFSYGPQVHADRETYHPSVSDKRIIKEALKALGVPGWKAWATDCNEDEVEQEMLYATILMCTSKVMHLDIDDGPLSYKMPKWLDLMRRATSGSRFGRTHQFSHLKSMRVDVAMLKLRHLAPLFKLESMRELELIGLQELAETHEGKPDFLQRLLPTKSSPIEDLSFQTSFLNADVLSVVLGSIKTLKRFQYEHADQRFLTLGDGREDYWLGSNRPRSPNRYPLPMLKYPSLLSALQSHRQSLETLHLSEDIEERDLEEPFGILGSLHDFDKLNSIEAPLSALVDVHHKEQGIVYENLPTLLKTVAVGIGWDKREYDAIAALEHMAIYCREFFPSLEQFNIKTKASAWQYTYDWDRLRHPLSEAGVEFVVEQTQVEDDDSDWVGRSDDDSDTESESETESLYST